MLPATVVRLANEFAIVQLRKQREISFKTMQLIKDAPKDFLVISGDDIIALPMVLAGGAGVISVIGKDFQKNFQR